jgi:hypothetical protein
MDAASVALLFAAAAPPMGPVPQSEAEAAQVEQIAPLKPSSGIANVTTTLPVRPTVVEQLPADVTASDGDESEAALIAGSVGQSRTAAVEIARAFEVIRGRGQVPTAELIAREVGPDVLQSYLQSNPAALADPTPKPPVQTTPVVPLPGIVIIPPKG